MRQNERVNAFRLMEIESREQVIREVREVHEKKLWREQGFRSLTEYCQQSLGYNTAATKDVLVTLGLVIPTENLRSDDPEVQLKINRLLDWRRATASKMAIAAYRIINNRTLLNLAVSDVRNLQDLVKIKGIGPQKIADFGQQLLDVISEPNKTT